MAGRKCLDILCVATSRQSEKVDLEYGLYGLGM